MSVTNIFIARHGETEYNRQNKIQGRGIDASLNDTGRLQAHAIAYYLKTVGIQYIFSSSLKRSRETAEIVAKDLGLRIQSYDELDEMDFGIIEGRLIDDISGELNELHAIWKAGEVDFSPKHGESPQTVFRRVVSRIDLLLEQHQGSDILFILHGRLIRILLSGWLGYGLSQMHRIEHGNGALYHLQFVDGSFKPVYLNNIKHLEQVETS